MGGVPPLLQVDGFQVRRPSGQAYGLPELTLPRGRVAALYGPSGCGKTTVLHGLFGLLPRGTTVAGRVRVLGRGFLDAPADERRHVLRHDVGFLLQDAHAALDPLQPIGRQIAQATWRSEADAAAALAALGVRDAGSLCRRLPHQISGGQAQRVLLAVAFLRGPALLVADEPSASLDGGSYAELLAHLRALIGRGSGVLLATHDHRLLRDLGAAVHRWSDGSFVPGELDERPWPARREGHGVGAASVLAAEGVRVAFGERVVLDGVGFALRRGEVVAVTGESGAGKTTLARVLAGHRPPDAGTVRRPARRTAVQLCCQDAFGSLTPGRQLAALVAEARAPFFDLGRAAAALRLPAPALERPAARLSGGERRRGALLRALAVQPDVLVLDEPTAALDRDAAVAVIDSLLELQRSTGLAIVLASHDLDLANAVAHRTVVLQGGRLCPP